MNASRIGILQGALREQGLECAFLVPGPNLRYLTGLQLQGFERVILGIVPLAGDLAFVVPQLEADRVRAHIDAHIQCGAVFSYTDDAGPLAALRQALCALGLDLDLGSQVVGAEFLHMRLLDRDPEPARRGLLTAHLARPSPRPARIRGGPCPAPAQATGVGTA